MCLCLREDEGFINGISFSFFSLNIGYPNFKKKIPFFLAEFRHAIFLCCSCINCRFVWPRDLCYVRYWRRNDDGSYGKLIFLSISCLMFSFVITKLINSFLVLQLCYFVQESMRTVVLNQVMCGLMLRVSATLSPLVYA